MTTQLCTKVLLKTWGDDAKRLVVKLEHNLGPSHPPQHLTVQAQVPGVQIPPCGETHMTLP